MSFHTNLDRVLFPEWRYKKYHIDDTEVYSHFVEVYQEVKGKEKLLKPSPRRVEKGIKLFMYNVLREAFSADPVAIPKIPVTREVNLLFKTFHPKGTPGLKICKNLVDKVWNEILREEAIKEAS